MGPYRHRWHDDTPIELPVGKVVCVGRNYAAHARELNNPVPDQPLLFMKPATSLAPLEAPIVLSERLGNVHFETELAVLIGQPLTCASELAVEEAIVGFGLALDLTRRDLQSQLKEKGHPWERAKAFDGACPLSPFLPADRLGDPIGTTFSLERNGQLQQYGDTENMLMPVLPLVAHISETFTLEPGDVVLTGTPEGVGPLSCGDRLELWLAGESMGNTRVEPSGG